MKQLPDKIMITVSHLGDGNGVEIEVHHDDAEDAVVKLISNAEHGDIANFVGGAAAVLQSIGYEPGVAFLDDDQTTVTAVLNRVDEEHESIWSVEVYVRRATADEHLDVGIHRILDGMMDPSLSWCVGSSPRTCVFAGPLPLVERIVMNTLKANGTSPTSPLFSLMYDKYLASAIQVTA